MKQTSFALTFVLSLCVGLFGFSTVSAQGTVVELTENYTAAEDRIIFLYPLGWTVDKQNAFVGVSDTKTTIEFYTASLSQGVIDLANKNLEASVLSFLDILGVEALGVEIPDNQTTQITFGDDTFIGTSIIDKGQIQYIFLVKGVLMEEPGWVFVRVQGSALDLISNPDEFLAIIKSFGTFVTPDTAATTTITTARATSTPAPITVVTTQIPPTKVIVPTTVPAVPCTVQATLANTAALRVGPGTNRSILLFLSNNDTFEVIGTANDSTGARWWRLDKSKAAPAKAAQVNETWVADAQMTEFGDCDTVGTVAAPPIIRVRPTAAPAVATTAPNATAQPTPIPGSTEPFINFFASSDFIDEGDCTTLFWDVRNVKEIHLTGDSGVEKGVTGPTGSENVCPPVGFGFFSVTYTLRVVPLTGADIFTNVTVNINNTAVICLGGSYPYIYETYTLSTNETVTYTMFIDTTLCSSGSATIYIYVSGDIGDIDTYFDVYTNGSYYGNDDDSGGGLNSYMELTVTTPTTIQIDVSNLELGPGTFTIDAFAQ